MKKLILIIDDDPLVLRTYQKLLAREKYEVTSTASYEEALKAIENQSFNLVLSDIRMPGKNGVQTVSEIQNRLKGAGKADLPIIFITGYADYGDQLNANFLGEILTKPVDANKLLVTIRDYL